MVSVPVTPGRMVQVQDETQSRFRYAESRNFVGRAVEQAGGALSRAADDWDAVNAVYDTAAVKKLEVAVTDAARETLWTGEDAFFNRQGMDAADARPLVDEKFKNLREDALSQVTNERQRNMLTAALDKRLGDYSVDVSRHAVSQLNTELQKQAEARLSGFQQDAVRSFSDPERYADNIAGGIAEINALADQQGWTDDRIDDAEERFVSGVHSAVISGRLTADDVDGAIGLFAKYRDELSYNDAQSIEAKLQPAIQYRQAEDDALVALGSVPTSGPSEAPTPGVAADIHSQLKAIEGNESGGKQFDKRGRPLTSSAGAIGVMQVMPGTAPEAARMAGLAWDPKRYREDENYNRALGQAYYKEMLRKFGGDPVKAAAAYNAGPGSAARGTGVNGALAKARKAGEPENWVEYLPAETRDYVAKFQKKTGASSGGAADGSAERKWDLTAAYTALEDRAKKEAWTPERLERARQRVDERVKRDEMLSGRRDADEWETSLSTVDGLGESFTDVKQIPNFERLSPDRKIQLRNMADSNRNAALGDGPKANGDIAVALDIMAIEEPEKFLQQDLRVYRSQMTEGEHASLQKKAALIRAKPEQEVAFRGAISGTVSMFASPEMNLDGKKNEDRKRTVMGIMESYLRGHVKPGVQPTQPQLMEALRFATGNVKGKETPRTEMPVFKEVPPDILNAIIRAYRAETGRNPTDGQIISLYRRGNYK